MTAPLALTCGEPAGIGPEIVAAAWDRLQSSIPFFWIGEPAHLPDSLPVMLIDAPDEATRAIKDALPVLPHPFPSTAVPGSPAPEDARHVIAVIERAVGLAQTGVAGGVVTCPISKKALIDGAGFAFPGHTEFLAHLAGVERVAMMLACTDLRVVPATIHIPLAEVSAHVTPETVEAAIRLTHAGLISDFGLVEPRIAISGLNPHAGEGGAMGREDLDIIAPVIARLKIEGMDLTGPQPADTMFHPAARAAYDAAVMMYHDQALIPIKTIDFAGGVNVTLGLPFVRTSPDHGTAFDIAGRGIADPTSLVAAIEMAWEMANRRATAG